MTRDDPRPCVRCQQPEAWHSPWARDADTCHRYEPPASAGLKILSAILDRLTRKG